MEVYSMARQFNAEPKDVIKIIRDENRAGMLYNSVLRKKAAAFIYGAAVKEESKKEETAKKTESSAKEKKESPLAAKTVKEQILAFRERVRSVCHYLEDIAHCAKEKADAINDLADYFADGVESAERIQMQAGGDWAMYTLVQKMQIGRAIQVAQLITLLFQRLLDSDGQIYESSRAAIKKAQDELLKRDA